MKKRIPVFILLWITVGAGCTKQIVVDDPVFEEDPGVESLFHYEVNENQLLVWQPEDYTSDLDVKIETADTTKISISKDFYDRLDVRIQAESILNITLAEDELPFIRKISDISDQGGRYWMTTTFVSVEEMFRHLDLEVSSEPYYSGENLTRFGDQRAALVDADGVVHPSKYIIDYPDGTREVLNVHEYMATRGAIDFNFNWNPSTEFSIETEHLKLELALKAKLSAYAHLGIDISWFKLQKFEAKLGGGVQVELPMTLDMHLDLLKKQELDKDIITGPRVSTVFWVGIVPISVGMTPALNLTGELVLRAQAQATFGFDYNMSYQTGVRYERNKGWTPLNSFTQNLSGHDFVIGAAAQISAEVGLYAKLGLDIYGMKGLDVKLGAYINGDAAAVVDYRGATVNYHCAWGVDARLGAKVKILKWTLADWEARFNIFGPYTIIENEKTFN